MKLFIIKYFTGWYLNPSDCVYVRANDATHAVDKLVKERKWKDDKAVLSITPAHAFID